MINLSGSCAYNSTKMTPISAIKATQLCEQIWEAEFFATCARSLYPYQTTAYIWRLTGVPMRTVEHHLDGGKPCADHLMRYLNAGDLGVMLVGKFINAQLLMQVTCEQNGGADAPNSFTK